jgi:hypothetical protein
MVCGAESDYGAHGIKNGEVYDEYFCESCYHAKDRPSKTEEEVEDGEDSVHRGSAPENNEVRPSLPISGLGQHPDSQVTT